MRTAGNRALITGAGGQDGTYLVEHLLAGTADYSVCAIELHRRRAASFAEMFADQIERGQVTMVRGDIRDRALVDSVMESFRPTEIYNLAAQSHVGYSFSCPTLTTTTSLAIGLLLESMRAHVPKAHFFHASTSEMYGDRRAPQSTQTEFHPLSPYAAGKCEAHQIAQNYRNTGLFVSTAIMFNHESERRRPEFVTRKITQAAARAQVDPRHVITLGNIEARRDWGHAPEYVEALPLILHADNPDDHVLATGVSYSVADFAEEAFRQAGLDWQQHVRCNDPAELRPTDPAHLQGDPSATHAKLSWKASAPLGQLVMEMLAADVRRTANYSRWTPVGVSMSSV